MPRYSYLLFLLCAVPAFLSAQSDRHNLLKEYARLDSIAELAKGADDVKLVLEMSTRMLELGKQLQIDSLVMKAQALNGQALAHYGIFDVALKTYHELMDLAESSNDCYYKVKTATLIGGIHQNMLDWGKSQEFLDKAKRSAIACGMYADTLVINYDAARNLLNMGHPEAGIRLVEQTLNAARQSRNQVGILYGINDLSNILAEAGQFDKAMKVGLEVFELPQDLLGELEKAQIYQRLSQIAVELHDFDNAQKYGDEALALALQIGLNGLICECYRTQSDIDKAGGSFEKALANFQRYSDLKDSVYQNEYDAKMSAMIALYDLESKQKTISLLAKDQEIKAAQIQKQRILLIIGLLAALLIVFGIRFQNQRKTNQMQEAFGQDLIKAQESERQRISKELHDSVGQNILFVKNRLQRLLPPPETKLVDSVDAALEEIRNIAKDLYPNQLEQYGLSAAVDSLCELVRESSGVFVSSDLEGIDGKLTKEAKINCYRIIQECISNALKHAEASAIRITSNHYPDKVELVVQDNGKGFDKSLLERQSTRSFGMLNIAERIKMLHGKFDLESSLHKGAKFTFSIPV